MPSFIKLGRAFRDVTDGFPSRLLCERPELEGIIASLGRLPSELVFGAGIGGFVASRGHEFTL